MKTVNRILLLNLLFCLLTAGRSMANDISTEYYAAKPLDGSKGQIKKDSSVSVGDSVFLQYGYQASTVRNIITFRINEYSNLMLPDSFEVHLVYKVYYSRWSGSALVSDSTGLDSLIVTYNKLTGQYTSKAVFNFTGGYVATVKVFAVNSTKGNLANYVGVLMVDNEIWITRDYAFSCTADAITTLGLDTTLLPSTGELRAFWSKDRAADNYDLEWTYIDSSALANYYVTGGGSTIDPRKVFANNSTRVTVASEQYRMPMLYDNTGSLFFRVRSVKIAANGQRYESRWSQEYSAGLGRYNFKGHERKLNWQATTSFAEEGKRKSVVQYYDGSLRSRQTVTRDNTTDTTIVGESFYDYQGRPVIQVMPTPSLSRLIKYTPGFNLPLNGAEYDRTHYDTVMGSGSAYCDKGADSMISTAGASRYYSANNPNANNGYHKYIPAAKGYPFSETRYTQDNTGRVSVQGSVGYDLQIGRLDPDGKRHETKYYYLSAAQEDIDALFGTEAGNASHYFKTVIRDANGQYSVNYTDMNGRTVATALAGKPTQKLDTLASNKPILITRKLVDSTNNLVDGMSITSSRSLIATKNDSFRFVYSLMPDSISMQACSGTICYDCKYDLTITITDECNNGAWAGVPVTIRRSNLSVNGYDTVCNANVNFPAMDTTVFLPEGSYTVTKVLSINQKALSYYRDSVFLRRNTCNSLVQTIQTQKTLLQTLLQCYPSCQSCTDSLGTWTAYQQRYMARLGITPADSAGYRSQALDAYNDQKRSCDQLCNNAGIDDATLLLMLADVTPPGGQYADPNSIDASSIFSKDPSQRYKYQSVGQYVDEDGKPSLVTLPSGAQVRPQDLSMEDFIANFKSSWADSLLAKHPEYCKLQTLQSLKTSNVWDEKFQNTDSYATAQSLGYLNPTANSSWSARYGMPSAANQDPAYALMAGSYKSQMETAMQQEAAYDASGHYTEIWSLATMMAHCDPKDVTCHDYYKTNLHPFQVDAACSGELDMAWRFFREMYLQQKKKLVSKYINAACGAGVPNGHTSAFVDPTQGVPPGNTMPGDAAQGHAALTGYISDNCRAYVQQWWDQLAPCGYSSADSAIIVPRLRQVCQEGGDSAHAYGSSTAAPSSTYRFRSFEDVLKQYNDSTGRAYNATCNAYLITAPFPYDKQPVYVNMPLWNKPDSCQCSTISSLYTQFQQAGAGDANFSAWLLRTNGTSMSQGSLDTLRLMCNGTINCSYMPAPITLPPALQCGSKDVCATCAQVNLLSSQYRSKFPTALPTYDDTDSAQRVKNQLFENFMNNGLGFSMRTYEYLTFLDSCVAHSGGPMSCDTLRAVLERYRKSLYTLYAPRVDFSTQEEVHYTDLHVIEHGGYIALPDSIRAIPGGWYNNPGIFFQSPFCTSAGYSVEVRLKFLQSLPWGDAFYYNTPNLSTLFTRYPNSFVANGKTFQGGLYLTAVSDNAGMGWGSAYANNGFDYILADSNINGLLDWSNVVEKVTPNHYYIYFNSRLLFDVARDPSTPPGNVSAIATGMITRLGAWDWAKVFDANGKLIYFEDFNDPDHPALPLASALCTPPNPPAQFTSFFNGQKGTTYTYAQLDSLYYATCGDSSGLAYPVTADTTSFAGYCNKALKFDGVSNKHVRIPITQPRLNLGLGDFTLEARVKPKYTGAANYTVLSNRIITSGTLADGILFLVNSDGNLLFQFQSCPNYRTTSTAGINIFDGKAHMITLVKTKDSLSFFMDGVRLPYILSHCTTDSPTPYSQRTATSLAPYYIGYDSITPATQKFNGWINEVRIWNVARSQTQIQQALNVSLAPQSGLVGYFPMVGSDTCQQTIYDYSTLSDSSRNNGYLGLSTGADDHDPVWLAKNQISYTAADPSGAGNACGCSHPTYDPTPGLRLCGRSAPVFPPVIPVQHSTCDDSTSFAVVTGTLIYNAYKDSILGKFTDTYLAKCLKAYKYENLTVTAPTSEYHYTLYYYDQAGNLVKTVSPAGVNVSKLGWAVAWSDSVKLARRNRTVLTPVHTLATVYKYNTLNQVIAQQSPDGGLSTFWYDRLGRLALSQNARQKAFASSETSRGYSYTLYDPLGRIAEVGQIRNATASPMTDAVARLQTSLNTWLTNSAAGKEQIMQTVYDLPYTGFAGLPASPLVQRNLRNRVAYTSYSLGSNPAQYNSASFFTYDILGNVDTLVQDYGNNSFTVLQNVMNSNGNRFKKIVYRFDLVSGKVNHVAYQPNQVDQLFHRYTYDAENRIILTETSRDSIIWEKDARYQYYQHGPLARTVIGDQMVQGTDYAYTLQGWLKGVNGMSLTPGTDMGNDGSSGSQNRYVGKDAVGFSLNYFTGEYAPINGTVIPFPGFSGLLGTSYRPLYNGNISSMAVNIGKLHEGNTINYKKPLLYNYSYDQLNRLTGMDAYYGLDTINNTWSLTQMGDYRERIAYDPNGNILRYLRNNIGNIGVPGAAMDSLNYQYAAGSNQLLRIRDNAVASVGNGLDLQDQPQNNYAYDATGNLIGDSSQNIPKGGIQWNVYGKITQIDHSSTSASVPAKRIVFGYDAAGNRVSKKVTYGSGTTVDYTWYVRDAIGNVMATYTAKGDSTLALSALTLQLGEQHLYGSTRLGLITVGSSAEAAYTPWAPHLSFKRGLKQYELSNHLGNVLATVSDRKFGVALAGSPTLIDYFNAEVVAVNDYAPFGMLLQGRNAGGAGYRYGFNGKENDNEVKGPGDQIDYGERVYDPRVGRFMSIDPMTKKYPWYTPYQFAGNTPIQAIDIDGKEPLKKTIKSIEVFENGAKIKVTSELTIKVQVINLSTVENSSLSLQDLRNTIQSQFVDQISGSHTAAINQAYLWDPKRKDVGTAVGQYAQSVTYDTKVNFKFEVVDSKDKLTNDAIIIGIVDRPKGSSQGDVYGVANDIYGGGLVKADQIKDGKISMIGGKIVSHEIAHLFGAAEEDGSNTQNLMNAKGMGTKLTDKQIVEMMRFGVGNWNVLWKQKTAGKDLFVDETNKYYDAKKNIENLQREHTQ